MLGRFLPTPLIQLVEKVCTCMCRWISSANLSVSFGRLSRPFWLFTCGMLGKATPKHIPSTIHVHGALHAASTPFALWILGKGSPMQVTRLLEWMDIYIYICMCDLHYFGPLENRSMKLDRVSISIQ